MPANVLGALVSYMLISSFTPGPGNILTLNTMTTYGWKRGRVLFFGICTGYYAVQLVCAFAIWGLSRWLTPVLTVLKYLGAVYLLWLAIHIIRSKPATDGQDKKPSFWTGFLLQFVNVKIYFYGLTALNGYIVPYYDFLTALILMALILATVGSFASLIWAILGVRIQSFYKKHYKIANWILGAFLLYCAVSMLLV